MNLGQLSPTLPARLALGAVVLLALGACSDGGPGAAPVDGTRQTPTPTLSPTPSPTPSSEPSAPPELINYAGGEAAGVEVHVRADAKNLRGAPASFKRFIGNTAQEIADASNCDAGYVGVTVQTLRTDGFAVGGVNDCGGYAALWVVVDGHWKEAQGTQETWDCAVLKQYAVPSDVAGTTCYDYAAQQERTYHQK